MSKTRRYLITKDQSEVIRLGLVALIDHIKQDWKCSSPYWLLMQERAEQLKIDLEKYQWERPE